MSRAAFVAKHSGASSAPPPPTLRLVVGDETGMIKRVDLGGGEGAAPVVVRLGDTPQSRQNGIQSLCWAGTTAGMRRSEMASSLKRGVVQVWDMLNREVACRISGVGPGVVGMDVVASCEKLVACDAKGLISLSSIVGGGDAPTTFDMKMPTECMRVSPLVHAASASASASSSDSASKASSKSKSKDKSKSKSGKSAGRGCGAGTLTVAVGGEEHDLRLYNLDRFDIGPTFKAKNVPVDFLDMRVPVWISDIQWLGNDGRKIVTGTKHKQVRLYDILSNPRPCMDIPVGGNDGIVGDHPVTSIAVVPGGDSLVVADSAGTVRRLDLRMSGRCMYTYKGFGGGVREVRCHPTRPIIAGVSLDRHLIVHDLDSRKIMHKVYLKQRLTTLLFDKDRRGKVGDGEGKDGEGGEGGEDEEEEEEDESESDMDDETWMGLKRSGGGKGGESKNGGEDGSGGAGGAGGEGGAKRAKKD